MEIIDFVLTLIIADTLFIFIPAAVMAWAVRIILERTEK